MVDDQPKGTEHVMPVLLERIAAKGLTFTNGIAPTSLCCPSRASLLTGNLAHTTGVYTNANDGHGSWVTFHRGGAEADTVATRLDAVGYRTGLYGKYFNDFAANRDPGYTPPGWDVFNAFASSDGDYYDYRLTGVDESFASQPSDYSTDVLGDLARAHITSTPKRHSLVRVLRALRTP